MTRKITRRDFLKGAAASATFRFAPLTTGLFAYPGSAALGSEKVQAGKASRSTVVVVTDLKVVDGSWRVSPERSALMVQSLLLSLTGASTVEDSWYRIIPELKPTSRIAIKVNCINTSLPSHPEVTFAIAETLKRAGVAENNILIWDRYEGNIREGLFRCGYPINTSKRGIRCLAVNSSGVGFDEYTQLQVPSVRKSFSVTRIVSQMCDYMVNVSVLKDHSISGVTLSLKNFYGAIPLGNEFALVDIKRMHKNYGNPQIAELYNNPVIRDKTRLSVCDALLGCYQGGPTGRPQWVNYQLLASLDPVALDSVGLRIIEEKRLQAGLASVTPMAGYIRAAANLGLGTENLDEIDIRSSILS